MNDSQADILEQRIAILENRVARGRILLALGVLCGASVLSLGLSQHQETEQDQVLTVRKIVLRDRSGIERAILGENGNRYGFFVLPRVKTKGVDDLVFVGAQNVEGMAESEFGTVNTHSQLFTSHGAHMTAESIGLFDDESKMGLSLGMLKSPSLTFVDQSGLPFISLSHNSRSGSSFQMRSPLGIKDAVKALLEKHVEGKTDESIDEAYSKSLRIDLGVRPFTNPHCVFWKDGKATWSAE